MPKKLQSLESVLDEERREVLASLENQPRSATSISSNGSRIDASSPLQPVRSMLDFNLPSSSPRRISNNSVYGSSASQTSYFQNMYHFPPSTRNSPLSPSKLYLGSPRSPRRPSIRSLYDGPQTSGGGLLTPTDFNQGAYFARSASSRRASDMNLPTFGPRASFSASPTSHQYAWYLPSNPSVTNVPKRNMKREKRSSMSSAMVDAVKGELFRSKDPVKHVTSSNAGMAKAKCTHNYFGLRSSSPKPLEANKTKLSAPSAIKIQMGQRRRSSSQPIFHSGALLPLSTATPKENHNDGLSSEPKSEEDVAVTETEQALTESSDDWESEEDIMRGRNKTSESEIDPGKKRRNFRHRKESQSKSNDLDKEESQEIISAPPEKKSNTLSISEPEIVITRPNEQFAKFTGPKVHPMTSFDEAVSGFSSPHDSEVEAGMSDIKRAQKLAINTTAVVSTPATSRCVRSIHRGDFSKMQQEARDNQRRVRKYLVATDLSEEATHALEWTIGTVLRDGDTLLAIYCVDEELGITPTENSADDKTQEQIAAIAGSAKLSFSSPNLGPSHPQNHRRGNRGSSITNTPEPSPAGRERSKAEQERYRAVQDITDRVSELLRKTKLQVKVVIEVIHCKNPKHLITEVIDFITPTLVILGSRGRSALKGVILGSFSNYIVAKSSVPVMVARKRLRKHNKYKRPSIRLANNLENPHPALDSRTLAAARID